jgi:epoxide hydrolase 4
LHYVEAGEGPLVVLLHGFPEFWFGWRRQIAPLAAAGFRVVAPDTRGYNLSSKPEGFEAYAVDLLAADIRGLIEERGAESALLVGDDWGGRIAWITAMNHPEVVDRLAILNAAHPRRLSEGLKTQPPPGLTSSSACSPPAAPVWRLTRRKPKALTRKSIAASPSW